MVQGKILQKAVVFFVMGSLNLAMAGPVREWESFDGIGPEGATLPQRDFGEEEQAPEDIGVEAVEVAMPKRRNGMKPSHKALAMVQFRSGHIKGIKDETATTGENAKKRLPPSVKRQEITAPFMHDIHQEVLSNYLPVDFHHRKAD